MRPRDAAAPAKAHSPAKSGSANEPKKEQTTAMARVTRAKRGTTNNAAQEAEDPESIEMSSQ